MKKLILIKKSLRSELRRPLLAILFAIMMSLLMHSTQMKTFDGATCIPHVWMFAAMIISFLGCSVDFECYKKHHRNRCYVALTIING